MKKAFIITLSLLTLGFTQDPKSIQSTPKPSPSPAPKDIFKDTKVTDGVDDSYPKYDFLVKNKALLSGIERGTELLNGSVLSLMDSVFYSILDEEFRFDMTQDAWFSYNIKRDVYSTPYGAYVIVDKAFFGPSYQKVLSRIQKIPISLGLSGQIEILKIYLRTDGQRNAENKTLPYWRMMANNYFGLLPFLASILPPSFNANELYDPISELKTPFEFPLTIKEFEAMPVGSIRSYAISQGITLPIDLSRQILGNIVDQLENQNFAFLLPFSLFQQGTHRINLLKKSDRIAWVGVSRETTSGSSLSSLAGSTVYLLAGTAKPLPWPGIKIVFSPLDAKLLKEAIQKKDLLFQFDTKTAGGKKAYLAALGGDFSQAKSHIYRKKSSEPVVDFLLNKNEVGQNEGFETTNNLSLFRNKRKNTRGKAEIDVKEEKKTYTVLKSSQELVSSKWDVLFGAKEKTYDASVEIYVDKLVTERNGVKTAKYEFKQQEPFHLQVNLFIRDNSVTYEQFLDYLDNVSEFTQITIERLKTINHFFTETLKENKRFASNLSPDDTMLYYHSTPVPLGKFNASASVFFSYEALQSIIQSPPERIRSAFATTYGIWDEQSPSFLSSVSAFFRKVGFAPLALFNYYDLKSLRNREVENAILHLEKLRKANGPLNAQMAFFNFFDNQFPELTVKALMLLAKKEEIARKADFHMKAEKYLPDELKDILNDYNKKTFTGGKKFPDLSSYQIAEEKLQAFYPKPLESDLKIISYDIFIDDAGLMSAKIKVDSPKKQDIFGYIRLESFANLQLAANILAEEVFKLADYELEKHQTADGHFIYKYQFQLSGEDSPLTNFFLERQINQVNEFKFIISLSCDKETWGTKTIVRFTKTKNRIKIKKD